MTAIDHSHAKIGNGVFGRLNALYATAIGAFSAWNDSRVTRKALSKLSDRELDDIGLCRGDIDNI